MLPNLLFYSNLKGDPGFRIIWNVFNSENSFQKCHFNSSQNCKERKWTEITNSRSVNVLKRCLTVSTYCTRLDCFCKLLQPLKRLETLSHIVCKFLAETLFGKLHAARHETGPAHGLRAGCWRDSQRWHSHWLFNKTKCQLFNTLQNGETFKSNQMVF